MNDINLGHVYMEMNVKIGAELRKRKKPSENLKQQKNNSFAEASLLKNHENEALKPIDVIIEKIYN